MGLCRLCFNLVMVLTIVLSILILYMAIKGPLQSTERPQLKNGWWGPGKVSKPDNEEIKPFQVNYPKERLADLNQRLAKTNHFQSLEGSKFRYGFRNEYLEQVVKYWKEKYNWRQQEKILNKYNHYKTKVEGIDVHFIHIKGKTKPGQRAIPLMMVHGWPGSFYEFYKVIPLLTGATDQNVIDLVLPSIPGYGYSEAPHQQGFDASDAARVMHKLMLRLGYPEFYIQGGDWGSAITSLMATMYPSAVKGLHVNMVFADRQFSTVGFIREVIVWLFPSLVLAKEEAHLSQPPLVGTLLKFGDEIGYALIQASKPDTIGTGLMDSPAGLAAYILEKFSSWTNMENRDLEDGGLFKKFNKDELLTNVMIYWTSGNIVPSMRFYKETFSGFKSLSSSGSSPLEWAGVPTIVPTAIAQFPNEFIQTPIYLAKIRYQNIVQVTYMPSGGHFAAFEEPVLLADDVRKFIAKVEDDRKISTIKKEL